MGTTPNGLIILLLGGGAGKRFWPISTKSNPKQCIKLPFLEKTLLELTIENSSLLSDVNNIYICAPSEIKDKIIPLMGKIPPENFIEEPLRRNTGPAISYALFQILKKREDAYVLILPSDHIIESFSKFKKYVEKAYDFLKKNDGLITFGIKPSSPETGYGYIQIKEMIKDSKGIYKVKSFVEKPPKEIAIHFVKSGEFLWNAGIFMWRISFFFSELKKHASDLYEPLREFFEKNGNLLHYYSTLPNISIDYALMEKSDKIYTIKTNISWIDMGTWKSLYNFLKKKLKNKTITIGKNVYLQNSQKIIVFNETSKNVLIYGLKNYVVAVSSNGILIWPLDKEQEIKNAIESIPE